MEDPDFEWDDAKAASNLARHRVSFEAAKLAFEDPFALVRDDFREDYGEDRWTITGMAAGRLLFVAYTMRESRTRIIMARFAEPFERRLYHEANWED